MTHQEANIHKAFDYHLKLPNSCLKLPGILLLASAGQWIWTMTYTWNAMCAAPG